jgi:hypothetical protein
MAGRWRGLGAHGRFRPRRRMHARAGIRPGRPAASRSHWHPPIVVGCILLQKAPRPETGRWRDWTLMTASDPADQAGARSRWHLTWEAGCITPPPGCPPRRSGSPAHLAAWRHRQSAAPGKHLRLKPAGFWTLVWDRRPGWATLNSKKRLNVVSILRRHPNLDIAGCIRSGRPGIGPEVETRQREPQYRVRTRRGSRRTEQPAPCDAEQEHAHEKDEAEHQEGAVAPFGLVS